MTPEDAADAVSPGTTALVIGSPQRRRGYCRHSLGTANQAAAVVLPKTSADIETVQASGGAPAHQVVVTDRGLIAGSDTTCIRIDSRSVPAVVEAGLAVLTGEESSPVDRRGSRPRRHRSPLIPKRRTDYCTFSHNRSANRARSRGSYSIHRLIRKPDVSSAV